MDTVDKKTRSRIMAAVKGKGNKSTEGRLRMALVSAGVRGWRLHSRVATGRPDFAFEARRVAVFVDGCFWHGCPRCYRAPTSNKKYWTDKIKRNQSRDRAVTRALRRAGWQVVRLWECGLGDLQKIARKIADAADGAPRKALNVRARAQR